MAILDRLSLNVIRDTARCATLGSLTNKWQSLACKQARVNNQIEFNWIGEESRFLAVSGAVLVSACAGVFWCGRCDCFGVGLGALGVILGAFLVHCVLCYAWSSDSVCWREPMDSGTSSPYIFLFM